MLALISLYVGADPGLLLVWGAWLLGYAILAAILTLLVRLAPSPLWTLLVHATACAAMMMLSTASANDLFRLAFPWTAIRWS